MTASGRSRARRSTRGSKTSKALPASNAAALLLAAVLVSLSVLAAYTFYTRGFTLYYGDAEAHLNIARRIVDSRTRGYEQTGTYWLPLLHWLLIPFVRIDEWWRSGLAGVIPSAVSFVAAGMFLYTAARRSLGSVEAGVAAVLVFALNPNLLYLQSTPMTEPLFLACQLGLVASVVWFAQSGRWLAVIAAGAAGLCGTLVRYDGWFLLPFAAAAILASAKRNRWTAALLFCAIAGAGPLYWLIHNRWFYSNWLEFFEGPGSPRGIQGDRPYPGRDDWLVAARYYATAGMLVTGIPALIAGAAGAIGVVLRRAWWPLVLLASVPLFYVAGMQAGGSPIFVPDLWPGTYYNSRYGIAVLPLAAFAAAGLVSMTPQRLRAIAVFAVVAVSVSPWIAYPRSENWVTFQEAQVNSRDRRAWTRDVAAFFADEYRTGDGVYTSFDDTVAIYRVAGIPLKQTLHEGNSLIWHAARLRPDLFFWQKWAVARAGSPISIGLREAQKRGERIECVRIIKAGQATIEIFRNDNSLRQGTRRP